MMTEAFWKRVKTLVKEKNLTQGAAASACGRSLSTVKGWMSKNIIPPLDNAFDLAQLLEVSLEYLITGRTHDKMETAKTNHEVIVMLKKASEKLRYI